MKSKNLSDIEKTRNGKIWDPIWDDLNEIIASFNPHLVANSFPLSYQSRSKAIPLLYYSPASHTPSVLELSIR